MTVHARARPRWTVRAASLIALALATLTTTARPARAGSCGGDEAVLGTVKDLERFARRGGTPPEIGEFCVEEAMGDPALARRILKACYAIVARDPGHVDCFYWAEAQGVHTVGGVDVWSKLAPIYEPIDPFGSGRTIVGIAIRLGEVRAVAPVRAAWEASLTDPRATKKARAHDYKVFRNNAITLFGKLGGEAERAFLAAQLRR